MMRTAIQGLREQEVAREGTPAEQKMSDQVTRVQEGIGVLVGWIDDVGLELRVTGEVDQETRTRMTRFQGIIDEINQELRKQEVARKEMTEQEMRDQVAQFQDEIEELVEQNERMRLDNYAFGLANYWIDLLEIFEYQMVNEGLLRRQRQNLNTAASGGSVSPAL
jgi:hypothetical protein